MKIMTLENKHLYTDERVQVPLAHFGLFLLRGINNRGAADFGNLASLAVKRPAAYLISQHVFNEQHSAVKAQPQLIEQLNVLQKVIIRVAEETGYILMKNSTSHYIFDQLKKLITFMHFQKIELMTLALLVLCSTV